MDQRKVHVILASVDHSYGRRKVLAWFVSRPYFLPYVPLLFFLGVISGVVNKAPFDVSLCHDMFKWTHVI